MPASHSARAALAALAVLAAAAPAAQARPADVRVDSGTTRLTIAGTTAAGMAVAGISLSPVSPARSGGSNVLVFPVTGGSVSTSLRGSVSHGGGMKVRKGGRSVTVRSFVADLSRKVLTATSGGDRIDLLTLSGVRGSVRGGRVSASATALLTRAGARAFNRALKTSLFSAGQLLGSARLSAR